MSAERAEEILQAVGLVYRDAGWNALNPAAKTMLAALITDALASSQAEVARLREELSDTVEARGLLARLLKRAEQRAAALEAALRKIAEDAEYNWIFGISAEARAALDRAAPRPEGA